jgi:hypothetical protein
MDEIDINFVRTRKIDYLDTYKKLDRKYKLEKSSQYPVFNRLQKWKIFLSEQEEEKIDSIQNENNYILNENIFFKNRIINIKQVPTITNYAHIIEQNKKLQHEIYIWTKRMNIAQVNI